MNPETLDTGDLTNDRRDVADALELVGEICDLADEVSTRGQDFAESVRETAAEIGATIEKRNEVTAKQFEALDNFLKGLRAWVRN